MKANIVNSSLWGRWLHNHVGLAYSQILHRSLCKEDIYWAETCRYIVYPGFTRAPSRGVFISWDFVLELSAKSLGKAFIGWYISKIFFRFYTILDLTTHKNDILDRTSWWAHEEKQKTHICLCVYMWGLLIYSLHYDLKNAKEILFLNARSSNWCVIPQWIWVKNMHYKGQSI